METKHFPLVSFIIPAYNSQPTIGRCLEAIHQLDYPAERVEIIVVDNGSRDETVRIAARLGAKVLERPDIFVSEMRNQGAELAAGEILGFVDSDCVVSPSWLVNALRHLEDPAVAVAGCGYALDSSPCWIERHWHYLHLAPPRLVNFVPAGNMMIKKAVFQHVGGFDTRLESGEDSDLCLRLRKGGFQIISDGAIENVHLGNPKTLSAFLRKEIWYGRGLAACLTGDDWRDRTFLLTNLFLIGLALTAAGIPLLILLDNPLLLMLGLAGIAFVVLLSTIYRTVQRRALPGFFHLALLNTVYYLGRSISLLQVYGGLYRKTHRTAKQ